MTYKRPENMSYTDMCIYIDENAYSDNPNYELIYQYLYHIMYMLAGQARFFKEERNYDYFGLYAANRLYFRLTNPKQYDLVNGEPKMRRITSILNYAKNTLYPMKVDFEQSEYCQSISKDSYSGMSLPLSGVVVNATDKLKRSEFELVLHDVSKTCRCFMKTIPYKPQSVEWLNIYTSVVLSFLNAITLKNKSSRRVEHLTETNRINQQHYDEFYDAERNSPCILYHLPDSMGPYVTVLTKQLMRVVSQDLFEILESQTVLSPMDFISSEEDFYEY